MERKDYMNLEKRITLLQITVNFLIAISIIHGIVLILLQSPHLSVQLSNLLKQLK